jgi:hypothetical protein
MDILRNVFGGGTPDNYQQRYEQYQRGHQSGGFDDIDDADVLDRYQRTLQHAPPDVVAAAHEEAFNRLPPEERQRIVEQLRRANDDPRQPYRYDGFTGGAQDYDPRRMGDMFGQAQRQQPDLLQQVLGPGGAMSNPLAKMAMAGVAAAVAGKLMGAPGSGGGILGQGGGLLGGMGGNRR